MFCCFVYVFFGVCFDFFLWICLCFCSWIFLFFGFCVFFFCIYLLSVFGWLVWVWCRGRRVVDVWGVLDVGDFVSRVGGVLLV